MIYTDGVHLVGDELQELHQFAQSVGLKREWFQEEQPDHPHYDITTRRMLRKILNTNMVTKVSTKELVRNIAKGRKEEGMDKQYPTKMYPKMCEEARKEVKELQKQPNSLLPGAVNIPEWDYNGVCFINIDNKYFLWLPTQSELQEMIGTEIISKYVKYTTIDTSLYWNQLFAITKWLDILSRKKDHYADIVMIFEAGELWLAFLMYGRCQKKWDINKKKWRE